MYDNKMCTGSPMWNSPATMYLRHPRTNQIMICRYLANGNGLV